MSSLQALKNRAFKNAEVKKEYVALDEEFEFIDTLLQMRTSAGLTQEELANLMGTNQNDISHLEKGNVNPSWNTLKKYAQACGFNLSINAQAVI